LIAVEPPVAIRQSRSGRFFEELFDRTRPGSLEVDNSFKLLNILPLSMDSPGVGMLFGAFCFAARSILTIDIAVLIGRSNRCLQHGLTIVDKCLILLKFRSFTTLAVLSRRPRTEH
jgi:hypothetical protein